MTKQSPPGTAQLRRTDRRNLVATLERLASPDPTERAKAAERATRIVEKRGASWTELLLPEVADEAAAALADPANDNWPAAVLALLQRPDLTDADRVELRKIAAWRTLGRRGLEVLRAGQRRLEASVP